MGNANSGRRHWEPGEREALEVRAIAMWKDHRTLREIGAELGVSETLVMALKGDTKRDFRPKKKERLAVALDLRQARKRQLIADRKRNKSMENSQIDVPSRALAMPPSSIGFNVSGPHVDPHLSDAAQSVLRTWTTDTARGRLVTVPPPEILKALTVRVHSFRMYTWEEFASNRHEWGALRSLAGVRMETVADRAGISFASISRYEVRAGHTEPSRNPDPPVARRLFETYKGVAENFLVTLEWKLITHAYLEAGAGNPDEPLDFDDLSWWAVGDSSAEDLDITHIATLRGIRRQLPHPTWREPSPGNLYLSGYRAKVTA